jgi:hypothetical protein
MTDNTDTTTTDADAMPWPESPVMDLHGVQAILQLLAWAEASMPYECIGETRRVALMLLEDTMGRAMRNLGLENLEMERDKAAAAAKPEPVQADTIALDRMESFGIWRDMLNIRDTAKGASKILAAGPLDEDVYQIVTGMVELMAEKLDALCERHDRATSGTTKAA